MPMHSVDVKNGKLEERFYFGGQTSQPIYLAYVALFFLPLNSIQIEHGS